MVERVARVLQNFDESFLLDDALDPAYIFWTRSAIAAMREPTDDPVVAVLKATRGHGNPAQIKENWRVMIRAVLK